VRSGQVKPRTVLRSQQAKGRTSRCHADEREARLGPEFIDAFQRVSFHSITARRRPAQRGPARQPLEDVFRRRCRETGLRLFGNVLSKHRPGKAARFAIFDFSLLFVFLILAALYEAVAAVQRAAEHAGAILEPLEYLWLRRVLLAGSCLLRWSY